MHEKFHTVFLKGLRNISGTLSTPPYEISSAEVHSVYFSPPEREVARAPLARPQAEVFEKGSAKDSEIGAGVGFQFDLGSSREKDIEQCIYLT